MPTSFLWVAMPPALKHLSSRHISFGVPVIPILIRPGIRPLLSDGGLYRHSAKTVEVCWNEAVSSLGYGWGKKGKGSTGAGRQLHALLAAQSPGAAHTSLSELMAEHLLAQRALSPLQSNSGEICWDKSSRALHRK